MLEVVFMVCTIANPFKCEERRERPEYLDPMPVICHSRALQEAAKWADKNPGYVVKRIGCARPSFASK